MFCPIWPLIRENHVGGSNVVVIEIIIIIISELITGAFHWT